jgi:hypothetical protein
MNTDGETSTSPLKLATFMNKSIILLKKKLQKEKGSRKLKVSKNKYMN